MELEELCARYGIDINALRAMVNGAPPGGGGGEQGPPPPPLPQELLGQR